MVLHHCFPFSLFLQAHFSALLCFVLFYFSFLCFVLLSLFCSALLRGVSLGPEGLFALPVSVSTSVSTSLCNRPHPSPRSSLCRRSPAAPTAPSLSQRHCPSPVSPPGPSPSCFRPQARPHEGSENCAKVVGRRAAAFWPHRSPRRPALGSSGVCAEGDQ